ncbi:XRE family transcriptional regulator [Marinicauda algicola]|uniref:XRE family transcriptional regulator n=1 Tax=Marinicauda algicola TaxID=2029849 RepID=A0A4S2GYD7_9PROT|nr:XRE family transcriptional regulator [Marinicauda algicola]
MAERIGVHHEMIGQWERAEHEPRCRYMPAIIEFLNDDTWLPALTFSDRLKRFRQSRGWSQKRLGKWLGCSERPIGRWEDGQYPRSQVTAKIEERIKGSTPKSDRQRAGPGKRSTIERRTQ